MPEEVNMDRRVRERLRQVGARRGVLRIAQQQLLADTIAVLRDAHGVVPIAEAARLAGVARSTAYEALERGDGDDDHGGQAAATT
jgi:hypothetical protein